MKRGKSHDYLGTDIGFSKKGSVKMSIIKCVKKVVGAFSEEIKSTSNSLAAYHLL